MELSYWESRWRKGNIGFHVEGVFPALVDCFSAFDLPENPLTIVPLCGKSHDMIWLAEKGHRVIGIEAVEEACEQFFEEQKWVHKKESMPHFKCYTSEKITLLNGDFLKLTSESLEGSAPDFIYDRAAIVALPKKMRRRYAETLTRLTKPDTLYFLHTFDYNQFEMDGPPFSVTYAEILDLYGKDWEIERVMNRSILEHLEKFKNRGLKNMYEQVFKLNRK